MLRLYSRNFSEDDCSKIFYFIILQNDLNTVLYVSEEKTVNLTDNRLSIQFDTFYVDDVTNDKIEIEHLICNTNNKLKLYKKSKETEYDCLLGTFIFNIDTFKRDMVDYLVESANAYDHHVLILFSDINKNVLQTFEHIHYNERNLRYNELKVRKSNVVESYSFNQLIKIDKLDSYYLTNIRKEIDELRRDIDKKLHFKKFINNLKLNYYLEDSKFISKQINIQQGNVLDLHDKMIEIGKVKDKIQKKISNLNNNNKTELESPINNPLYQALMEKTLNYKKNIKKVNSLLLDALQLEFKQIDLETDIFIASNNIQKFNYKLGSMLLYLQIIHKILKIPLFFNNHKMVLKYKSSQSFIIIVTKEENQIGMNRLIIPFYILSLNSLDKNGDYFKQFKLGIDWLNSKILIIQKCLHHFN